MALALALAAAAQNAGAAADGGGFDDWDLLGLPGLLGLPLNDDRSAVGR